MEESPMLNLKKSKGNILTRNQRNTRNALVMVLPAILFLALLIAYPLGKVIHDSFFFTNLINKAITGFAGVQNFQKVISDEHFSQAVTNTCLWTFFSVLGEYILGMLTAVLLNQKFRGRAVFRTFVFIPWLVPIIVAGMTWNWLLDPSFGIVNYLMLHFNLIKNPIDFLGDARYALSTVIFVNIWRSFPYYTISFLSAMQSIPLELNEAAATDGAGMFRRFFSVTLPQLRSVSLVIVFMHIIWTSINFDFIWVMTQGGPNYATETLPLMIYKYSMQKFDVGAASSLSTMMFTVMTIFFVVYYRVRNKISDDI
jgi:multiple sugar transport system permease protein